MKAPGRDPGRRRSPTPLRALFRGLLAGSGGTAAMTAYHLVYGVGVAGTYAAADLL